MPSDQSPEPNNAPNPSGEGITTAEIMDLPRPQREIMLLLMRDPSGRDNGLTTSEIAAKLPRAVDLPATLATLVESSWLIRHGDDGDASAFRYAANLKRKRAGSLNALWNTVLNEIEEAPPKPSKPRIDLFKRLE